MKKQIKENNTTEEVVVDKEKNITMIADELKRKHNLKEVFVTDIAGLKIIWRKLKRSEYKEVATTEFNENEDLAFYEKQDFVASKVILYPDNVTELIEDYAGISDIIASEAMVKSGFGIANTRTV